MLIVLLRDMLIAKDFTQTEDINYIDTFSPVFKMTTIRVLLFKTASQKHDDLNKTFMPIF